MSLEISVAVVGAVASIIAAAISTFLKGSIEHRDQKEKDKALEDVKNRITEVGLNIAGVSVVHRVDHSPEPQLQLTDQLLREIEEEIAERVSAKGGWSTEEVQAEIDRSLKEVGSRIEAIEERFPDKSSIDKIASINDALFAERIDQLSNRIDSIEESLLTKWDVAITVSLVVAGIFAVVGATYAALKAFGVVP